MRFSTATVLSTFAAVAAAYTQPDYSKDPSGNPIYTPSLNEQVPEGKPFEITWDPTLGDVVSLVLLQGPSTNTHVLETIVENIENTGSYTWTPSTSLTPQTTHYGLLLVVEGTGAYQWSTQFGISAADSSSSSSSSSSSASTSATASASASVSDAIVTVVEDKTTTICPETETQATATANPTTAVEATTVLETTTAAPTAPATIPLPTGTLSRRPIKPSASPASSALSASGTTTATPVATPAYNAAGQNTISFGAVVAALFAVMAF
ncbi:Ser-Thr-rich glycosyl-phosphatidyl-inositol-anchored membrane family-domain-containing protein [Penicillium odoratum]|uniref:Ser-Thr-rich glycosyl-phosphatidyl-inositol-anchored membrane family-domain-containing protein n=1 Tax=Penicillium odoratum TaxID=1167516 RepID=UPI0025472E34|nr:Ser-Thr-rich glycosyl-phosphatidyl-inositol-anchored membrane family-domain-containing protein [Penicillium odoratum]KAJ5746465.1 Ser-Thr-rich glycosyl-phosphatidyl-inositol-anchored membrane family-domain-containing protein [Penicillium odoratum]